MFSRQTQRGKSRTYIALAPGTSEVFPSLCQQSRRLAVQGSFRRLAVTQKGLQKVPHSVPEVVFLAEHCSHLNSASFEPPQGRTKRPTLAQARR